MARRRTSPRSRRSPRPASPPEPARPLGPPPRQRRLSRWRRGDAGGSASSPRWDLAQPESESRAGVGDGGPGVEVARRGRRWRARGRSRAPGSEMAGPEQHAEHRPAGHVLAGVVICSPRERSSSADGSSSSAAHRMSTVSTACPNRRDECSPGERSTTTPLFRSPRGHARPICTGSSAPSWPGPWGPARGGPARAGPAGHSLHGTALPTEELDLLRRFLQWMTRLTLEGLSEGRIMARRAAAPSVPSRGARTAQCRPRGPAPRHRRPSGWRTRARTRSGACAPAAVSPVRPSAKGPAPFGLAHQGPDPFGGPARRPQCRSRGAAPMGPARRT